jgi:hypothetical protein
LEAAALLNQFIRVQLEDTLQAIRPCRESETGWTPEAATRFLGNHSSWRLNERGPALKVFWSRRWAGWAQGLVNTRGLPKRARVVREPVTKKTEPEGAGQVRSFRFEKFFHRLINLTTR